MCLMHKGCFTPPLDVMVTRPTHRTCYPTVHDVVKDDTRCLHFLPDGDVWVRCLDADVRCLDCRRKLDVCCVTDGFKMLLFDDADIDKDVCITEGLVELLCLKVLVGCLGCIHVPDEV